MDLKWEWSKMETAVQSLFANLIEETEIQVPINQGQDTNNFAALPTLSKTATFVKERIHPKKENFTPFLLTL